MPHSRDVRIRVVDQELRVACGVRIWSAAQRRIEGKSGGRAFVRRIPKMSKE